MYFSRLSVLDRKQGSASTPPQVAEDDMDDVVEEEEWLQQVDEVYDKLSVQHRIYYDSYNLCDLCETQKLGSFAAILKLLLS